MIRETPKPRRMSAWLGVATVSPQAPASSWAATSSGDMVVLACGTSSIPCPLAKAASVSMLCRSALRRATITGKVNAPPNSGDPTAASRSTIPFIDSPALRAMIRAPLSRGPYPSPEAVRARHRREFGSSGLLTATCQEWCHLPLIRNLS